MNLLLIGGGGREHALAWKLRQSPLLDRLYCAPGNAGIEAVADCVALDVADHAAVIGFCREKDIGLVVIGPEAPLVAGLADDLEAAGIKVFGPSRGGRAARRLQRLHQGSLRRIRHPDGRLSPLRRRRPRPRPMWPRRACPSSSRPTASPPARAWWSRRRARRPHAAIDDCFGGAFGAAGAEVVIEEFLDGEEASFFALVDGETALPLATAQDHKRAFDGDQGPNTGGMGAYSPAPIMTPALCAQVMERDHHADGARDAGARHAVQGRALCRADDHRTARPKLIEYNVRFGDPETQVLMLRLKSDLLPALLAVAEGRLSGVALDWHDDAALCVVMATRGYPGVLREGLGDQRARCGRRRPECAGLPCRHQARRARASSPMAAACSASPRGARTFAEAQTRAYAAVDKIDWPGGFCRRDIGWRAV